MVDPALPIACDLLRRFEGFRPNAYADPAHGWAVPTIGFGATGPEIKRGTVWTKEQSEADLERRVTALLRTLRQACRVELTPGMAAALASLGYNIGTKALLDSRLFKRLNEGALLAAADQFPLWKHAGKTDDGRPRVLAVLVKRRAEERAVFLAALPTLLESTS